MAGTTGADQSSYPIQFAIEYPDRPLSRRYRLQTISPAERPVRVLNGELNWIGTLIRARGASHCALLLIRPGTVTGPLA